MPREGYVCNICNTPGHFIKDCPQKVVKEGQPAHGEQPLSENGVPSGYICKICNVGGHFIQDCPQKQPKPMEGQLPEGYVCKICQTPGHHIRDCPSKKPTMFDETNNNGLLPTPIGILCLYIYINLYFFFFFYFFFHFFFSFFRCFSPPEIILHTFNNTLS